MCIPGAAEGPKPRRVARPLMRECTECRQFWGDSKNTLRA
ncbi:hypothetical protein [Azospirillum endophyticum]